MFLDNRTPFPAERFVSTDRHAVEHLVVVVKATFQVEDNGSTGIGATQVPVVLADEHYGEPGTSSVRYECDCVPPKPNVDVIVIGQAHAPTGREVTELDTELRVGSARKRIRVFGDRVWMTSGAGVASVHSRPRPFSRIPLVYERAFGGTDTSSDNPDRHSTDMRNPVGRGFRARVDGVAGTPLPNLENPADLVSTWRSRPEPVGFGCVPRSNIARRRYAGTYDQQWLDTRFPFLPDDFDTRYFQCASEDQQFPALAAGEVIRCLGMTPEGDWQFRLPHFNFPVHVLRRESEHILEPRLGTVIVEPDARQCVLVWHASVPVGPKLHDIVRIVVGAMSTAEMRARSSGKHYFRSIGELIEWQDELRAETES